MIVPVSRSWEFCDIRHFPFPGPKDVRNPALSKQDTDSRDILNVGTYRACSMRQLSGTVPICVQVTVFPSPSLMIFGFITCIEVKAFFWLNI